MAQDTHGASSTAVPVKPALKLNFLSHGTLESRDLDFTRRFYEEFLGLEVHRTSPISLMVRLGGDHVYAVVLSKRTTPMVLLNHNGLDVETQAEVDEAHRVMRGLVDASPWFGDLLPELFSGMNRAQLGFPVSYPTSCSPQAWAAASPLLFLRTLLRFEPDIRANKLHLAPAVPDWIGTLRLERIPIMGGHLGVEVTGEVVKVLEVPEDLTIVSDPRRPTAPR